MTIGASGITKTGTGTLTVGSAATNGQGVGITLGANQSWTNNSTGELTVFNAIGGAGNLTLAGTGTIRIAGFTEAGATDLFSTYTGTTTISSGVTVIAQGSSALGSAAAGTTVLAGGTLNLGGTLAVNTLNLGAEVLTINGAGVGGIGALTNTGTAGQQNATQQVVLGSNSSIGGTQRWDIRSGNLLGSSLNGGGFTLTKVGVNYIPLVNTNVTNLNQIVIQNGGMGAEVSSVLNSAAITNGVLIQPTATNTSFMLLWGSNVTHSANMTLDAAAAGATARLEAQNGSPVLTGTVTIAGAGTKNIDVDAGYRLTLNGDLAGTVQVNKVDTGALILNNAANTHSGILNVTGGILGGSGTINSSQVNMANGTTISPGNHINGAGTLTVTNSIVSTGANFGIFNIGATSDQVSVGTLQQDGTTQISVVLGSGATAGTPYTIFDYGTLAGSGGFGGYSVLPSHISASLANNATTGAIELTLNSVERVTFTGASNNILVNGSLTNPTLSNFAWSPAAGGAVEAVTGDNVTFDDTATGSTSLFIGTGGFSPNSLVFNNTAKNYTVDGVISGTTGLVKDGTGTLQFLGAQTFNGPVTINAGTVRLGSDSRSGALQGSSTSGIDNAGPAISIAAGATLALTTGTAGEVGYTNRISGDGRIVLDATETDKFYNFTGARGNTSLRGDNSGFTGTITVNANNRLRLAHPNALGAATGLTIVDGGAVLALDAFVTPATYATPISVSGFGWKEGTGQLGAIRMGAGNIMSGAITLTGDSRFTAYTGTTGTLSGLISGGFNLELGLNQIGGTNSGTLNITNAANTFSGNVALTRMVAVNAATIADGGTNSSLGSGSVISIDGSTLNITGAGAMTSNRSIINGAMGIGGTTIGLTDAAATLTLTGGITNPIPAGSQFGQGLSFQQTITAGTGGTIILDTATPIVTTGTTMHRQNLTLAGNTNYTVGASGVNAAGTFNVGNSVAGNTGNATLTVQDNAVLSVYGEFDIGNQGVAQTYVVNQSGNSIVNALRGGGAGTDSNILHRSMRIGHWPAENSTYNLTGGTLNVPNGHLWVGWDGQATFNQSAGTTVNAAGLRMVNGATLPAAYNLNGGILNVGAYGFAKGGAGATVPQFNFDGGTYRATAEHAISGNIAINMLAGGGTINTNGFDVSSGSGILVGAGGALTKAGLGELTLASNNTVSGGILISGGSLSSAAGAAITASTVTVNNGGTLGGGFTVTSLGGVVVNSGGTVSPGANNGALGGTLTTSLLTLNAGSQVNLTPTSDVITVTTASTGLSGNTNINVLPVGTLAASPINLINYTTGHGLTFTASLPHLIAASVTDNTTGNIQLIHGGQETLTWSGAATGDWNTASVNFNASASGAVNYLQGDVTVFDDITTPATTAVTIGAGGVTPASVVINDVTGVFAFTGGGINGGTSVVKNGGGNTVLATNNAYTGGTTINAGTLQIGNGGTAGTLGLGPIANVGTLAFNRSDASSVPGIISGAGVVRSDGTGTTTLTGVNTYTGGTVISKGTLEGNLASLVAGAITPFGTGPITLNDAATGANNTALLVRNGTAQIIANNIAVTNNGTGIATIGSSEDSIVASGLVFSGTLTLDRPTRLLGEFDRTTFTNVISGNVGTLTIGRSTGLEDQEMGRVVLEKDNTFVGDVVVQDNTFLQLNDISNLPANTAKNQIPDTSAVTLGHNSWLQIALSGTAIDEEVIGDLISTQSSSRVRSLNNNAMNFTFGTANNTTFAGVLDGGNTLTHVKQGSGIFTVGGTYDNVSTRLVVNGGTAILAKDSMNTVHAIGTSLVVNNGAVAQLGGTFVENRSIDLGRNTPGGKPLGAPANYVDQIWGAASVTVNAGGTFDLNGKSETINVLDGTGTVTNSNATASTLYIGTNNGAGNFTGVIQDGAGVVNLEKLGTGTSILGGNNLYTGVTEIRGGALSITSATALGSDTVGTNMRVNSDGVVILNLNIAGGTIAAPTIFSEPITMESELSIAVTQRNTIQTTTAVSGTIAVIGDITLSGDGIFNFSSNQVATPENLIIGSSITGTSNGIIFMRGNGLLELSGTVNVPNATLAKTDPGVFTISNSGHNWFETSLVHGTTNLAVDDGLDTGAVLRLGQNANGNTFDLKGFDQTVAGARLNIGVTDAANRSITNTNLADQSVFTLNVPAAAGVDYSYGGSIQGNLKLVKTGAGDQVLTTPLGAGVVNNYTGDTVIQQGTLRLGNSNLIPDGAGFGNVVMIGGAGTGSLDLNGNAETINGLDGAVGATISSNGAGTGALTITGAGTFAGVIANNTDTGLGLLSLTKSGTGTETLSGINTYTGATSVTAGTLSVTGSISGSAVTVSGTGTLNGTGTVGALNLNGGGTLAPGLSPGILNAGNTTFNGGTAAFEIGGTTAGTGYDQLNVAGTVTFAANTPFTIDLGVFDPSGGGPFTLVANDGTDAVNLGGFGFSYLGTPLAEGDAFNVGANVFYISYAGGTDSNDIVVVPEPGSAIMLLGGVGMLLGLQRRRRRA